jgi:hypothetical protein
MTPAVHETTYPRLRETVMPTDLAEVYTPTVEEHTLASSTSPRPGARLGFLVLLKTFQRLGYFVLVGEVPPPIVQHIARCLGLDPSPDEFLRYDESGTRRRHIPIIRAFLDVRPYDRAARSLIAAVVRAAARTKEDLADLINVAIEVEENRDTPDGEVATNVSPPNFVVNLDPLLSCGWSRLS